MKPSSIDPAPQPPPRPDLDDCCRSGCTPCVFDLYEEAMDRYRVELKAWEARQAMKKDKHDSRQGGPC